MEERERERERERESEKERDKVINVCKDWRERGKGIVE